MMTTTMMIKVGDGGHRPSRKIARAALAISENVCYFKKKNIIIIILLFKNCHATLVNYLTNYTNKRPKIEHFLNASD